MRTTLKLGIATLITTGVSVILTGYFGVGAFLIPIGLLAALLFVPFLARPIALGTLLALPVTVQVFGFNLFPLIYSYILLILVFGLAYARLPLPQGSRLLVMVLSAFWFAYVVSLPGSPSISNGAASLVKWTALLLFYVPAGWVLRGDEQRIREFTFALLLLGGLLCISLLGWSVFSGISLLDKAALAVHIRRLVPMWPNYLAVHLSMIVILGLPLTKHLCGMKRVVTYLMLGTIGFVVVLSQARGAYIVLLMAGLSFIVQQKNAAGRVLVTLVALFLALGAYSSPPVQRALEYSLSGSSLEYGLDNSVYARLARTEQALEIVKESPLAGKGFNSADTVMPFYYNANVGSELHTGSFHNQYVSLLVRSGMIGLTALLVFVVSRMRWVAVGGEMTLSPYLRDMRRAVLVLMLGVLIVGFTLDLMENEQIMALIMVTLGMMSGVPQRRNEESSVLLPTHGEA